MKKEDIIKQKLFETCKLSEFYLDLIVNCQDNYDESEFLLSKAYSKKLYEIVARYDSLLEINEIEQRQLNERLTSSMDDALTISQTNNPCSTMNNSLLYDSDDDEDEYENEYNYYKYATKQHYVDTPNTSNGEIEEEDVEEDEEEEEEVDDDVDQEIDEPKQRQMIEKSLSNLSKDSGISILNDNNYYANDCCSNNSTTSTNNSSSSSSTDRYTNNNNNNNNHHGTHMLRKLSENDYSNETSLSGSIYESRQAIDAEFDNGNNDNINDLTLFDDNDKLQDSTYNLYTPPLRRSSVASDLLTDSNCGLTKSSICNNRNHNNDDNENNNKQMLTSTAKRNRFIHVQSMDSLNETIDSMVNQQDYKLNALNNSEIVYQSIESPPQIFSKSNLMDVSMIENIEATNRSTDYDYMNSSILFFK